MNRIASPNYTSKPFARRLRRFAGATALAVAFLATPVIATAAGVPVDMANDEQKQQAQAKFIEGREALEGNQLDAALAGFRASYDVVASPNAHLMIGHTLAAMGKHMEAWEELKATRAEAEQAVAVDEKYRSTIDGANAKMDEIRPNLGFVTVRVDGMAPPGSSLTVNGKTIPESEWGGEVVVAPGAVNVVLTTPSGSEPREVQVAPGGNAEVAVPVPSGDMTPPPEGEGSGFEAEADGEGLFADTSGIRIASYVSAGVGVVGMVAFAVLGSMTKSRFSDLEDQCAANNCPASAQGDIDSGQDLQVGANVSLVVGIVGLAAGAGLFTWSVLDNDDGGSESSDEDFASTVRPELVVGPGSVSLRGTF
jgi:hypothetical protein